MVRRDGGIRNGKRLEKISSYGAFSLREWGCKLSTVAIGLGTLLFTVDSMGDTFEMIEGKGTAVCEAYLLAAQEWAPGAMACLGDRPLDAKGIARISAPIRQIESSDEEGSPAYELNRSAAEFVGRHDRNLAAYYYADRLGEWRGTPEQTAVAQQTIVNRNLKFSSDGVLRILQVDVDNDGTREDVLFFPHCYTGSTATSMTMASPLILADNRAEVDADRTLKLLREPVRHRFNPHPRRVGGSWVVDADISSGAAYGFLSFEGKTYFDFWWDVEPRRVPEPKDANVLRVYLPSGSSARSVCSFRVTSGPQK